MQPLYRDYDTIIFCAVSGVSLSSFAHLPTRRPPFVQAQLTPEAGGLGGKSYVLTCGEGDFPSRRLRQMASRYQVRRGSNGGAAIDTAVCCYR